MVDKKMDISSVEEAMKVCICSNCSIIGVTHL